MNIEVIRVRNPAAFEVDQIAEILQRALDTNKLIEDHEAALDELKHMVRDPRVALLVAADGLEYKGVALATSNNSALSPCCRVLHIYNRGGPKTLVALTRAVKDFAVESGHDRVIGTNVNGKPAAYERLFGRRAEGVKTLGQTYIFEIGDLL